MCWCCLCERLSAKPANMSAKARRSRCVNGKPVHGRPPARLGGVLDGGGLLNVTPSTVGDIDGLLVPPDDVVPPPGGGAAVPPPAGHALLLDDVVGNSVVLRGVSARSLLPVRGTVTMPSVGPARGVPGGEAVTFGDGRPAALEAISASPAHNAKALARSRGSLKWPHITDATTHNPG